MFSRKHYCLHVQQEQTAICNVHVDFSSENKELMNFWEIQYIKNITINTHSYWNIFAKQDYKGEKEVWWL